MAEIYKKGKPIEVRVYDEDLKLTATFVVKYGEVRTQERIHKVTKKSRELTTDFYAAQSQTALNTLMRDNPSVNSTGPGCSCFGRKARVLINTGTSTYAANDRIVLTPGREVGTPGDFGYEIEHVIVLPPIAEKGLSGGGKNEFRPIFEKITKEMMDIVEKNRKARRSGKGTKRKSASTAVASDAADIPSERCSDPAF